MSWKLGDIEIYIDVSEQGRMQLGINPGKNLLEELFPIDYRKQNILSKHDWKDYERGILRKREEWVRENIPAGRYIINIDLDSENMVRQYNVKVKL